MFRQTAFAALALLAAAGFGGRAEAAPQTYEFDKAHTQIMFFADHLGFARSHGDFLDFDGHYIFDPDAPEASSVEVTIKTASVDMNMEKWSEHLKGPDFFNSEKYPEMTFKSTAVKVTGDKEADVEGNLTLLGVTKPVTLHVRYNKGGKHPFMNRYETGFSATARIDRAQWGMTYGAEMMDTNVDIVIEVEGFHPVSESEKQ